MIRTRDFLLYSVVLAFVVLSAIHTGLASRATTEAIRLIWSGNVAPSEFAAFSPETEQPTGSRWEELRARLAAGDGYLEDAPADFTSVDQRAIAEQQSATGSANVPVGERAVQRCGGATLSSSVTQWPTNTTVVTSEGQRLVQFTEAREVAVGTSTVMEEQVVTHTVLPIRSVRSTFDSCIDSQVIGITTSGQPLSNTAASQFSSAAPTQPVGYTRDGFTVYGPVPDEATLDACGGQYIGSQYQYHIRQSEPFILGCFAGVPVLID